jgi:hypothetical protein
MALGFGGTLARVNRCLVGLNAGHLRELCTACSDTGAKLVEDFRHEAVLAASTAGIRGDVRRPCDHVP